MIKKVEKGVKSKMFLVMGVIFYCNVDWLKILFKFVEVEGKGG